MGFITVQNGFGPVEKDRSNGGSRPGDGGALTIAGQIFEKGLGVHTLSDVRVPLDGRCTSFLAFVGIDDENDSVDQNGRVVFSLLADGKRVFGSDAIDFSDRPLPVNVNITGVRVLNLVVTSVGNDPSSQADWAEARVTCR